MDALVETTPVDEEVTGLPLRQVLSELSRLRVAEARRVRLLGCDGPLQAAVVASLAGALPASQRPLIVIASDGSEAQALARDLGLFLPQSAEADPAAPPRVMLLPELETAPWADVSPDRRAILRRMATLFRLSQGLTGEVLVTSAAGFSRRVVPRAAFAELVDVLQAEEEIDRDRTLALLARGGYSRAPVVEDPGTFAVRGGVIDVFVPLYRFPFRVELMGDLVESIRFFDPSTQRTLRPVPEVFIHPVRETILTRGATPRERLLEVADHVAHPSGKTRAILDQIEAGEDFFGVEALTPAFHERMAPITEYLPPGATLFVDEPDTIFDALEDELARGDEAYHARVAEHRLAFPPAQFFLSPGELRGAFADARAIEVRALDLAGDGAPSLRIHSTSNGELSTELRRAMAEKHEHLLRPLVAEIHELGEDGARTILVSPNLPHAERLESLLRGYGLSPHLYRTVEPFDLLNIPRPGALEIRIGPLAHGFRLPADGIAVITEAEIFGEKSTRRAAKTPKTAVSDAGGFRDLEVGAFIVHKLHGVGTYRGLTKLPVATRRTGPPPKDGAAEGPLGGSCDFLHLEYDGGALYLPVWRLDEVQRYVGADGVKPKVDRLGGLTWAKTRSRVSAEVKKLAEDLLQIYAQRLALPGHGYHLDSDGEQLFREFELAFPFEETIDQQKAIDDVLADLEQDRPMDRLVCGDVGYGKTEVAMRAAVKVALGGKQVAVLAPTTVLVEQHAVTFAERLKDFPIRVASLSRFKSRPEQIEVIKALAEGKIDVVVGTHRLLSADVRFKDLGMLVIDEEHRFGVSHKERLKAMRTQIDCLTMSATPIPRTLHMALTGIREISIITTPPADRLAIRTLLARYDDALLVEGIKRELARGGQVFFVHNRVEDIHKWSAKLRELLPELRVGVGHGQMPAEDLERVMVDFVDGKFDVLVCTTIIESGLDIARANTMFVDRADTFGLAQLYQLRGRIGRAKVRAYCYLLVPPEGSLSSEAKQRLAVLQKFTELGAGFQIASHDLDIRGAGDLLGAKQSGQIAAVGFEMYTQLLEEAVATLRGESIVQERDPELTCDLPGYIPDDYLPDTSQRLDFYKRLSSARNEEQVGGLVSELTDRYGAPPVEVEMLAEIMIVKGLGRKLAATAIELSESRLALALGDETPLKPEKVMELVNRKRSPWRLTPDMRLSRTWQEAERPDRLKIARKVIEELLASTRG
ncbi:MAG: transcription-repair coupling factor [Myxococcales bacterium]|nr:transcription-repair coupling factor [Myxococcales bacterium]